ncbi:MAG: ketopantoate reductase family protein [Chloroflexi bacterium]|nr:MAG: ketopantoate reductase family protein [Chloroflexota bacterium]
MKHGVLGPGGVGGFIAATLARAGSPVSVITRNRDHPPAIEVQSAALGSWSAPVQVVPRLETDAVDLLWVTVKATQLDAALELAPAELVRGTVVPLLNGIDHVARLREVYGHVTPGAFGGESERSAPGRILQSSPFAWVQVAGYLAGPISLTFDGSGLKCTEAEDENVMLWQKLLLLAPLALLTTAEELPVGGIISKPALEQRLLACVGEAAAVAQALGVKVAPEPVIKAIAGLPAGFRTSMQKDRAAGQPIELDAIAGPILRGGRETGVPTPEVAALAERLQPFA